LVLEDRRELLSWAAMGVAALSGLLLELAGFNAPARLLLGGIGSYLLARFGYLVTVERKFTVDLLMSFAALTTFYYNLVVEGLILMLLYAVAETTESAVERYAEAKLTGLIKVIPERVVVEERGGSRIVETRKVKPGSIVLVRRGEAVPLDGILLNSGHFDTSLVTGEPVPVKVEAGSLVESGYINLGDPVKIRVVRGYDESLLQVVASKAREALERKGRRERLINRLSPHITIATLAGFFIALYISGPYKALPLLFAGCPSALIIASSYSTSLTVASLATRGVIARGGIALERGSEVSVVALDKTGTITTGVPRVSRVTVRGPESEESLVRLVASAASASRHPIAIALSRMSSERSMPSMVKEKPGMGMEAVVDGRRVLIGSKDFMELNGVDVSGVADSCEAHEGRVYASVDGTVAAICLDEEVSEDVINAVNKLKQKYHLVLVSGDTRERVTRICARLGVSDCYYSMKPDDKLRVVDKYRRQRGPVAMVGDGINDVEALAASDMGIAVGNIEAVTSVADATLTQGLPQLPHLLEASKRYIYSLKASFAVAILVKLYAAVAGVMEAIPLVVVAFIADDGSTLAAVASSTLVLGKLIKTRIGSIIRDAGLRLGQGKI